jgi:hypothetical protein
MNRDREWDFIDEAHHKLSDEKTLLATFAIVTKELALQCPNDQELGKQVRQLIKKYEKNTNNS